MKKKGLIKLSMFGSLLMLSGRTYTNLKISQSRFLAFIGLVFLAFFGTGAIQAATYTSPAGFSLSHNITVVPGSHTFVVGGITTERYTYWYVDYVYTGDEDRSWWGNGFGDPEHSYSFSSGTTVIEARVYDGDLNYLEYHRWWCTVTPPDLVVSYVQPSPLPSGPPSGGKYYVGDNINCEVRVQNTGDGDADYSYVGYYLGSSPSDLSHQIGEESTIPLASGQWEIDQDMYWFQPSDVGYPRYLICMADRTNRVDEEDENNNTNYYGPFEVALLCPSAPTGVSASDGTYPDKIRVTWNISPDATSYEIWRGIEPLLFNAGQIALLPNPPFDDYGVIPATTYYYWVKASNSSCSSDPSSSDSGYTSCSVPSPPTNVSASDGTICDQVYITWNPSSGADEYRVYRSGFIPVSNWQSGTSYTDIPGDCSTHTYWVKAQNSCGESGLGSSDPGYAMCSPSVPTGVSASDGTICGQVYITWNPVSEFNSYTYMVYRDSVQIGITSNTSYIDIPGDCSIHTYQVGAENPCGTSVLPVSDPGHAMCIPVITIDPVQDPDPVCDGNDVTFTVVATGDSLHYQWYFDGTPDGFDNPIYQIDNVQFSDDGVQITCDVSNTCGTVTSNPTTLTVNPFNPCDSARSFPSPVEPSSTTTITIDVNPDVSVQVYAVEDVPPVGWTVSNINESGTWDSVNEKVKWGLFFDNTARTLTYDITVPADANDCYPISGITSFDGVDQMICGAIEICVDPNDPPVPWSFEPNCYSSSLPVLVTIDVTPDVSVQVYAVEDSPPANWVASNINEGGAWDDVNKKVKWGLFFDNNPRTLMYDITPPPGETDEKTFSGTASFDGVDESFDRYISQCPCPTVGDFDDDCDVDEDDLRILVGNWLEGVQ